MNRFRVSLGGEAPMLEDYPMIVVVQHTVGTAHIRSAIGTLWLPEEGEAMRERVLLSTSCMKPPSPLLLGESHACPK